HYCRRVPYGAQRSEQGRKHSRASQPSLRRQPTHDTAQQTHHPFGAFHIASKPVQVVRDATLELIATATQCNRLSSRWQQAKLQRWTVRYYPGIFTATLLLHGHHGRVWYRRDAGKSSWHDGVSGGGGSDGGAEHQGPRLNTPHRMPHGAS